jgi:hypothetical protein
MTRNAREGSDGTKRSSASVAALNISFVDPHGCSACSPPSAPSKQDDSVARAVASIRPVDTCQAFRVVRIGPWAGTIAARLSGLVHCRGKSFGRVAPTLAPSALAYRRHRQGCRQLRLQVAAGSRHVLMAWPWALSGTT